MISSEISKMSLVLGPRTGLAKIGASGKIYVGMSSGVDSSTVASWLCRAFGKDRIRGIFMNNWSSTSRCSERDWVDVQKVCDFIGIERKRVDFSRDYWIDVFEPLVSAYRRGLTPNPDVSCNRYVKFGALMEYLHKTDPEFGFLATGHYAGLQDGLLCRPTYLPKDQSYYLSTVHPKVWERVIFPLAHTTKPAVREAAKTLGLPTATKSDSQGLCFVEQADKHFDNFLAEYIEPQRGPVITTDGTVVGEHNGLWTATIGQRTSISMPQANPLTRGKWFVCNKIPQNNTMVIARGHDSEHLYSRLVRCKSFVWHSKPHGHLQAQFRSLQVPVDVDTFSDNDGELVVTLAESRRGIAPGQNLVIYEGAKVIGAGVISSTDKVAEAV